jgi:ribosomal protein S18 acetylase RimI-like enzyme
MLATEALTIRPYEARDDDFVAALAKDAFDEYMPRAVLHTLSLVRRCTTLVALQELRTRTVLTAGSPAVSPRRHARVGFAAMAEEGDATLVLNAIAVVRGERGRGIGHRLMVELEALGRERGVRRLQLCTADYNLAALDLFYRCGFHLAARRTRFYGRGQDACVLVKHLR